MDLATSLWVIFSGFLHALWNALASKISVEKTSLVLIPVAYTLVVCPVLFLTQLPDRAAWPYLIGSAIVHIVYVFALLKAYTFASYSIAYPVSRALGPLILVIALLFVPNQKVTGLEILGVGILLSGIFLFAVVKGLTFTIFVQSFMYVIIVGFCIAAYSLLDAFGIRNTQNHDVVSYAVWMFFLQGFLILPFIVVNNSCIAQLKSSKIKPVIVTFITAAISIIAYGIVIWAQGQVPEKTGVIAALRESGILFSVLLGLLFLNEKMGVKKTVASIVCLIGIVLIVTK